MTNEKVGSESPLDDGGSTLTILTKKKKVGPKAKTKAVEAASTHDTLTEVAHKIENLDKSEAYSFAHSLLNQAEFSFFQLGGVLSVIQTHGWFVDDGYENFRAFVEAEFGIQYRKAMYLLSIYNGLIESGVPWGKVQNIGWTKLKELVHVLTPDNVDEWREKAESMTVLQLQDAIKSQAVSPEDKTAVGESTKVTTLTIKVHEDQKEVISEAIEQAKLDAGTEYPAVALEAICISYLSGGKIKATKPKSLTTQMAELGWESVLETFGETFKDVDLTVYVGSPEEGASETVNAETH